jgi:hypothetical protein
LKGVVRAVYRVCRGSSRTRLEGVWNVDLISLRATEGTRRKPKRKQRATRTVEDVPYEPFWPPPTTQAGPVLPLAPTTLTTADVVPPRTPPPRHPPLKALGKPNPRPMPAPPLSLSSTAAELKIGEAVLAMAPTGLGVEVALSKMTGARVCGLTMVTGRGTVEEGR